MATDPLIGTQAGDYVIQSLLGRGGMARVYRGYDANLDRYAAVKVIDAHLLAGDESDEYYERFQREARSIARLRHPNIVSVYQFGQVEPQYYMAMVFIDGKDLRQILKSHVRQGTLMSPALVLKIMKAMTSALDYAHSQGVIHRDIKPSNILVMEDGTAVLTDFGLALDTTDGTIGNTFGSAHYIAPEQAVSSAHAVPQSDMYSLGICLYEMLTGSVPFDDASAMSVALKHLSDPPPLPSQLNPEITPEIEDVIMTVLEKEPEDRYETCAAFMQALEVAFAAKQRIATQEVEMAKAEASIPRPAEMVTPPRRPGFNASPSVPSPVSESRVSRGRSSSMSLLEQTAAKLKREGKDSPPVFVWVGIAAGLLLLLGLIGFVLNATGVFGGDTEPTLAVAMLTDEPVTTVEPTVTPIPTQVNALPLEESAEITLRYDEDTITLLNSSEDRVDVSDIVFVQFVSEDRTISVSASRIWARGAESPDDLPVGDCFQAWSRARFSRYPSPSYCSRQAFYGVQANSDFWIVNGDAKTFEVRLEDQTLATCDVEAGECSVRVPLAD